MYTIKNFDKSGREFDLKTNLSEFNLYEFEQISEILNNSNYDNIEKYLEIFKLLKISDDVINEMNDDVFFDIVKQMSFKEDISQELINEIEIDGHKFEAYAGETFKLKIKDLSLIENCVNKESNYLSKAIAIIFKIKEDTITNHYDIKHIQWKTELFKTINVAIVFPYIMFISEKLSKKIKMLADDNI